MDERQRMAYLDAARRIFADIPQGLRWRRHDSSIVHVSVLTREALPSCRRALPWMWTMARRAIISAAIMMAGYQFGLRVARERNEEVQTLLRASYLYEAQRAAGLLPASEKRCDWKTVAGVCMDFIDTPEYP